jgi:hypothetical protein
MWTGVLIIFHHWPFLNMVIHSYILRFGRALFSYCAQSLHWISYPGTLSAHKKSYHCTLLFFGAYEKQSSQVNSAAMTLQLAGEG